MLQKIILATPRGPCAGVHRAIVIVETALQKYGSPIYVNHEIVHNAHVVAEFQKKGVIFNAPIKDIPEESVFIFSAHGVSPLFRKKVEEKKFIIIDATCPLVTKVHEEAKKYAKEGYTILFIGHKGHPEVEGTSGVAKMTILENVQDAKNLKIPVENPLLACLTQTTLSQDETEKIIAVLQEKFPYLKTPKGSDICYATQNRQNAVKELSKKCDFIVVIGSSTSSNSQRLVDTAKKCGTPAQLLEFPEKIEGKIPQNIKVLGVTSGASVPEYLMETFLSHFKDIPKEVLCTSTENVHFPLPQI